MISALVSSSAYGSLWISTSGALVDCALVTVACFSAAQSRVSSVDVAASSCARRMCADSPGGRTRGASRPSSGDGSGCVGETAVGSSTALRGDTLRPLVQALPDHPEVFALN